MALAFDAVGPSAAGATGTSPVTWSHTCSGSQRVLLVGVAVGNTSGSDASNVVSVTYAGVAMTSIGIRHSNDNPFGFVQVFGLINPASGANNVVVTVTNSPDSIIGGSLSFNGADQTTGWGAPVTAIGTNALAAVNIGSTSGNIVAFFPCIGSLLNANPNSPGVLRFLKNLNNFSAAGNLGGATAPGTGSTVTCAWPTSSADWWAILAVEVKAATGGGASLTLGLVSETDSAFALTKTKSKAFGQSSESDSAFTLGRSKSVSLGQPVESDSTAGLARAKSSSLGLPAESGQALLLGFSKALALGVASSTDEAPSLSGSKSRGLGLTTGADATLPLEPAKSATFGLPAESDTVSALAPAKSLALGQAVEGDSVFALGRGKSLALGLPGETDITMALNLTGGVSLVLGLVASAESALTLGQPQKVKTFGLITETDLPLALGRTKSLVLGEPSEQDSVLAISFAKAVILGLATESGVALALDLDTGGVTPPAGPTIKVLHRGQVVEIPLANLKIIKGGVPVDAASVEVADAEG